MSKSDNDPLDLTAGGVVFGEWRTEVANDDLTLVSVGYLFSRSVEYPSDGFGLKPPNPPKPRDHDLEAIFLSKDKKAVVRFRFQNVRAFRVLDEAGLVELWEASAITPRPADTTFRVRGHGWQDESFLEWFMAAGPDYFSYMVATSLACLEVICSSEPSVDIQPAIEHAVEISGEGHMKTTVH